MRRQRAALLFKRIRVGKKIDKMKFPDRSFSDSGSLDEEKSEEEDESENGVCALCLAHNSEEENSEEENSEEEDSSRNYDSSD